MGIIFKSCRVVEDVVGNWLKRGDRVAYNNSGVAEYKLSIGRVKHASREQVKIFPEVGGKVMDRSITVEAWNVVKVAPDCNEYYEFEGTGI